MSRSHHRPVGKPPRPTSESVRTLKAEKQKAYVESDPRWQEHRQKLAAVQIARRFTLSDEEVKVILAHRRRGRSLSYIAEDIGIDREVLSREMRARDISTARIKSTPRAQRGQGLWRSFDDAPICHVSVS